MIPDIDLSRSIVGVLSAVFITALAGGIVGAWIHSRLHRCRPGRHETSYSPRGAGAAANQEHRTPGGRHAPGGRAESPHSPASGGSTYSYLSAQRRGQL